MSLPQIPGWDQAVSSKTNQSYYYHPIIKYSSYDVNEVRTLEARRERLPDGRLLPPSWATATSSTTQRVFYHSKLLNKRTYDLHEVFGEAAAPAAPATHAPSYSAGGAGTASIYQAPSAGGASAYQPPTQYAADSTANAFQPTGSYTGAGAGSGAAGTDSYQPPSSYSAPATYQAPTSYTAPPAYQAPTTLSEQPAADVIAAEAVAAGYGGVESQSGTTRTESAEYGLRLFNNWLKATLIEMYAPFPCHAVLDLACGKLGDLSKWQHVGTAKLAAIDISENQVNNAVSRFNEAMGKVLRDTESALAAPLSDFAREHATRRGDLDVPTDSDRSGSDDELGAEDSEDSDGAGPVLGGTGALPAATTYASLRGRAVRASATDVSDRLLSSGWGSMLVAAKFAVADMGVADFDQGGFFDDRLTPDGKLQREQFDCVSMQFALHYLFATEARAVQCFRTIAARLRPGGVFLGTMADSQVIVRRVRDATPAATIAAGGRGELGNSVYRIVFEPEDLKRQAQLGTQPFGCGYTFQLGKQVDDIREYLVPLQLLVTIAAAAGLELVHTENFHDFYAAAIDDASPWAAANKQRLKTQVRSKLAHAAKNQVRGPGLTQDEWDAIGLYRTFAFRKVGAPGPTPYYKALSSALAVSRHTTSLPAIRHLQGVAPDAGESTAASFVNAPGRGMTLHAPLPPAPGTHSAWHAAAAVGRPASDRPAAPALPSLALKSPASPCDIGRALAACPVPATSHPLQRWPPGHAPLAVPYALRVDPASEIVVWESKVKAAWSAWAADNPDPDHDAVVPVPAGADDSNTEQLAKQSRLAALAVTAPHLPEPASAGHTPAPASAAAQHEPVDALAALAATASAQMAL